MYQQRLFSPPRPRNVDWVRQDILDQSPNRPIKPVTAKLKRWVTESCAYYNARLECNSFSHEHAREIRKLWLSLLLEAHDDGIDETPVSLLSQAASQYTKPWIKNHEVQAQGHKRQDP